MTHREWVWWRALFRISPFDDERCFDLPAAHVAQQVNHLRGKAAPIGDFMPYRFKPPIEQLPAADQDLMSYLHSRRRH